MTLAEAHDAMSTTGAEIRFFTLTLDDGTRLLNNGTTKGDTIDEAETAVRKTWGMLSGMRAGKGIASVEFQEHGRVGEDRPVKEGDPEPEIRPYEANAPPASAEAGDDGTATLFRWNRSSLDESMATAQPPANR